MTTAGVAEVTLQDGEALLARTGSDTRALEILDVMMDPGGKATLKDVPGSRESWKGCS